MDLILALIVSLAAAWLLFVVVLWLLRPRDARLVDLVRAIPDVVRLCRDLITDPGSPMSVRVAIAGLLVYLVNPIDLIPEFIPFLGPLDDVVVAVLVLRYVRRRVGVDRLRQRWHGSPDGFELLRSVIG
jgi:uncharacterized membrane protein YkvA (DUF1232 family)